MTDIIFYFGVAVMIATYIGFVIYKFKEDDNIDLSKHKWIIIVYLGLLILGIFIWKIVYLLLTSSTQDMINYNNLIQSNING